MKRARIAVFALAASLTALACGASDALPPDDESVATTSSALEASPDDLAWVAQVMPIVVGRRVRGPGELLALANAAAQLGREHLLGELMKSNEFVERWAGFFLERFRIGRDPENGWYFSSCYATPVSTNRGDWEAAARTVRDTPGATAPSSGYNMADVVRGAIAIDNVFPAYRGYLFTLVQRSSTTEDDVDDLVAQGERGELFSQTFLNKSPVCMECHHTGWSATGSTNSWLLPGGPTPYPGIVPPYESRVFPSYTATAPPIVTFKPQNFASSFRSTSSGIVPFPGWSTSCGRVPADASPSDTTAGPNGLIRWAGSTPTVWKVDDALADGMRALPRAGWPALTSGPNVAIYWLAAAFANDVWREATGHSLTIPNFISRNASQFRKLEEVTDLAKSVDRDGRPTFSLRQVLSSILLSREFVTAPTSRVGKLYEPFQTEEPTDWAAERIHRYSADVLFRSAAYAVGQAKPTHFPTTSSFPTLSQAKAQGMSLSPSFREAASTSLEGMLNWEDTVTVGRCTPAVGQPDWVGALARYADARPELKTRDVVDALKFRIMSAPTASDEERTLVGRILGLAGLDESFAGRGRPGGTDPVVTGLRHLCATFMKSPEFMLGGEKGISLVGVPSLPIQIGDLVSGEAAEETEEQACMSWGIGSSSVIYMCDPADREAFRERWRHLQRICPRGRCFYLELPELILPPPICPVCAAWEPLFTTRPPPGIDPRVTEGLFRASVVPDIVASGGVFLAYAPGAKIVATSASLPLWRANGTQTKAQANTLLDEGDVIDIPPGVYVKIVDNEQKVFETPPTGLLAAPNQSAWAFMVTGPKGVLPKPLPQAVATPPMSQQALAQWLAQKADAERNGEPGSSTSIHTVIAPNGNTSRIDDPSANGKPDAVLIVSPRASSVANPRNVGVWYDAGSQRWGIYNEGLTAMPVGASFNVRALPPSPTAFVHRAAAATISGHITYLDHPSLNGNAEASVLVTHVWNPVGSPSVYNNHPVGVWYNTTSARWAIYNEDFAAMPANAAFNVKVGGHAVVVASAANLVNGAIVIDSPETNAIPGAKLFVTHHYNPPGAGFAYHTRAVGTRYDAAAGAGTGKWTVHNVDGTAIPAGVGFVIHRGY